jgi:hypothetical protein
VREEDEEEKCEQKKFYVCNTKKKQERKIKHMIRIIITNKYLRFVLLHTKHEKKDIF